jgi:hypothetical protein
MKQLILLMLSGSANALAQTPTVEINLTPAANFVFLHPEVMREALKKIPFYGWACYPKVTYQRTIIDPVRCLDCEAIRKEYERTGVQQQSRLHSQTTHYYFDYVCNASSPERSTHAEIILHETLIDLTFQGIRYEFRSSVTVTPPVSVQKD